MTSRGAFQAQHWETALMSGSRELASGRSFLCGEYSVHIFPVFSDAWPTCLYLIFPVALHLFYYMYDLQVFFTARKVHAYEIIGQSLK